MLGAVVLAVSLAATILLLWGAPARTPGAVPHHVHAVAGHAAESAHLAPIGAGAP
jgi:hypothetical protein